MKYSIDNKKNKSEELRAGATLIDLLIKSGANIVSISRVHQMNGKHKYMLGMTKEAYQTIIDTSSRDKIVNKATILPLVVPPKDWISNTVGGFYVHKTNFVKTKDILSSRFIRGKKLVDNYRIVNKLQQTSWRINKRVVDVIYDVFYDNLIDPTSAPTLPRGYGDIPISNMPDIRDLIRPMPEYDDTPEGKKIYGVWGRERDRIQIDLDAEVSRRLDLIITLSIAQKMIDYDKIWFVYTLDYRGRVYSAIDFLNPQGPAHVKAMLELGEGEYLNEEGLYWLKVHTANTFGKDKEVLDERIKWFDSNIHNIISVAEDWRDNIGIWSKADSPYEFLAACYAYKDYLEGNKVHIGVQLDATCSGLQMYSGLLLDAEGGRRVNIIGDTREDVYKDVAVEANRLLKEDFFPKYISYTDKAGKDITVNTHKEVKCLIGKIDRSIVKRPVMTIPYSVSKRGISLQIWDLMDKYKLKGKDFWRGGYDWLINKIISEVTYEGSYSLLQGAKIGQQYLKKIASTLDAPAVWHTPIYNFPVYQPAFKQKEHRVKTPIGTLLFRQKENKLDKLKQTNSIAANFIHSIDATVLNGVIDRAKYDVGVIHDCFIVHPNNSEEVRRAYRESFVAVMETKPLESFKKEVDINNKLQEPVPYVGTLNLEDVYNSVYIIS